MTALATAAPVTGGYDRTTARGIDRVIRISTAVAVLAVAGVAAYVSYWHAYAVVRAHGESGITARLEPATIDGLVYASSMIILYAARHQLPVPALARWLPGLGIAATLTPSMARGWSHGPAGAAVAAWPAASLAGSYELLVWLIRTAAALDGKAPAEHVSDRSASRAPRNPCPAPPADGEQQRQDGHEAREQAWQTTSQPAAQPAMPITTQRDGDVSVANAADDQAVAAYRLSARAGNPLSERKLARMFGRTSRRWARARITEARQSQQNPTPAALRDPHSDLRTSLSGERRSISDRAQGRLSPPIRHNSRP